jgi:hypothetical protein
MESLTIVLDLTNERLVSEPYTIFEHTGAIIIGGMPEGTESGKPVVLIALEIPEETPGRAFLISQTTLSLFLSTADALKAKYGDPRET